jgi:hypothetical protein
VGKLDQLRRDFAALEQVIIRFVGGFGAERIRDASAAFPADQHQEVFDEVTSRLETLQNVSTGKKDLAARIVRVSRQMHDLLDRFKKPADAVGGGKELRDCIEGEVIPLIDALLNAQRIEATVTDAAGTPTHLTGLQLRSWTIGNRIGRGGHGEVYRVESVVTGASMCLKVIPFATDPEERVEQKGRFPLCQRD